MSRGNFIGITNTPSNTSVTGVWTFAESYNAMVSGIWASPSATYVTSGLILFLDAGNSTSYPVKNFVSAKIYSTYNGGLRSSNYTVQYSDDNSTWTTAFSGVATNNTSCGIQQNTGVGSGSYGAHRYWRYVEGSAIASHHPRVSRIILTDIDGNDYSFITYTTDNCSDTGTYIVGTVSVDVGGTTWTDLSGNGITGTLTNGPTFSSSNGGSIVFDGSNDVVTGTSSIIDRNNGEEITVSCWVRPSRTSGQYSILVTSRSNDGGTYNWILYQHTTGGEISFHGINQNRSTYVPTINQWINVVNTVTAAGVSTLYINGTSVYTLNGYTYGNGKPGRLGIGANPGANEAYQGNISQVSVYNRALTQAEITQNYNAFKGRYGLS